MASGRASALGLLPATLILSPLWYTSLLVSLSIKGGTKGAPMKPALYLALILAPAAFGMANNLDGRWDGTIQFDDYRITFPIEFSSEGANVRVSFFNGDERVTSTAGKLDGTTLSVHFAHYATELAATLTEGVL